MGFVKGVITSTVILTIGSLGITSIVWPAHVIAFIVVLIIDVKKGFRNNYKNTLLFLIGEAIIPCGLIVYVLLMFKYLTGK